MFISSLKTPSLKHLEQYLTKYLGNVGLPNGYKINHHTQQTLTEHSSPGIAIPERKVAVLSTLTIWPGIAAGTHRRR